MVKFLVVIFISLVLIFLNPKKIFNPIQKILLEVAHPFQKMFFFTSKTLAEGFEFLGSIGSLKKENEKLLKENNVLISQVALLNDEKKENSMLREQLSLAPKKKFDLVSSFVIGQDSQYLNSWLLIDKGSEDGIKPGMPAIAYEGILIGKIEEVSANSSKIILLADSKSAVNVSDSETGARGILKGEYGLGIIMDMIMQTETLNIGDMIITSGLGGDLPRGLLVGKIQEIKTTKDKLFQQAIVVPRIKYSELGIVFVIKN
jgi:rod shape-determining protein MreC